MKRAVFAPVYHASFAPLSFSHLPLDPTSDLDMSLGASRRNPYFSTNLEFIVLC